MSKKKTQNKPEELESVAEIPAPAVEPVQKAEPIEIVAVPEPPKPEPVVQPQVVKTPKKRIRIRKKATKKLSAAILIKDPTITRFI